MPNALITVLWTAFGIILFYMVFIFAPSLVGLLGLLARLKTIDSSFDIPFKDYLEKYSCMIDEGKGYLTGLPYEEVCIRSRDGLELKGFHFGSSSRKTVIFVHGYHATAMVNFAYHGMEFHKRGYNVIMICQRAHCESGGRYCSMGIKEAGDVALWADWARERNGGDIVIYGTSMGAATVGFASANLDPDVVKALVMDCGFTSPYTQIKRELDRRHLPSFAMMPVMVFLSKLIFKADISEKAAGPLSRCRIPVCFIHGDADMTVPPEDSILNYGSTASAKKMFTVGGAPHTAGFLEADEGMKKEIFDFIERNTPKGEKQ